MHTTAHVIPPPRCAISPPKTRPRPSCLPGRSQPKPPSGGWRTAPLTGTSPSRERFSSGRRRPSGTQNRRGADVGAPLSPAATPPGPGKGPELSASMLRSAASPTVPVPVGRGVRHRAGIHRGQPAGRGRADARPYPGRVAEPCGFVARARADRLSPRPAGGGGGADGARHRRRRRQAGALAQHLRGLPAGRAAGRGAGGGAPGGDAGPGRSARAVQPGDGAVRPAGAAGLHRRGPALPGSAAQPAAGRT